MKPEIKALWLAELPKHKQAKGTLNNGVGMCCLGVLCEVARKEQLGDWADTLSRDFVMNGSYGDMVLPRPMWVWAEIDEIGTLPFYDRKEQQVSLTIANDIGCTFPQIADLIKHFF